MKPDNWHESNKERELSDSCEGMRNLLKSFENPVEISLGIYLHPDGAVTNKEKHILNIYTIARGEKDE